MWSIKMSMAHQKRRKEMTKGIFRHKKDGKIDSNFCKNYSGEVAL